MIIIYYIYIYIFSTELPTDINCKAVMDGIMRDKFTVEELSSIAKCLGSKISNSLSRDVYENKKVYGSDTFLEEFKLTGI